MDKLLVRIFIGLVAVIAALGLFTYTVLKVSHQVRFEHHWVDVTSVPMSFVASQASPKIFAEKYGVAVLPRAQDQYSNAFNARLDAGQTVFDQVDGRYRAWKSISSERMLVLDSDPSGVAIYELYLKILKNILDAESKLDKPSVLLETFGDKFQLEIAKVEDDKLISSQVALEALTDKGWYLSLEKNRGHALLRVADGQIYSVSLPEPFSSFSWPIIFFLLICIISALALAGYFLIKSFDHRLRNIETVASRIARGELDARVKRVDSDDSISRLGVAFNSMADHIQRLMYVQKEMIHAVSHELRTPVARIRFGVQMIEDCPSEEALRKQITGIDGDIQELDELIDEILTYARLEQGGPILAFQEADVASIVEQVISEQSSVKPDMKIYSEYKDGSEMWKLSEVETRYIHRSIQNLVGNATRYASGTVKVVCSFDQETCRVDVEDDGPGIPEDQWESVFTPFARLDDSRTRSSGGYGLGLSIVRRILYWHGGQAFLGRSPELGGAKFSLVWPRRQAES